LPQLTYSQSHTSPVYKYAAVFPATWTLEPGTTSNAADTIPNIGTSYLDFYGDGIASGVMVTSGPVSASRADLASWSAFITGTVRRDFGNYLELNTCLQSTRTLAVDGEPADEADVICPAHDWLWVTTVHAGRAYQIAWLDDGGFNAAYLRPLMDEFLKGFTFTK
jgi:hypothetical protein